MKIKKGTVSLIFSVLLSIGLMVFVFSKYSIKDVFLAFSNITPGLLLGYLAVSFIIMFLFAVRWQFVLKTLGYNISFGEIFSFRIIEYGISYVTPSGKAGGEPIRAALLMKKGIGFKEGLSTVFTDKTIELSVSLLFFVFGLLTLALSYAIPRGLSVLLIIVSLFLLFLIWKFYSRIMNGEPIFAHLFRIFRLHKIKAMAKYERTVEEFEAPIIKFYTEKRKAFFIALIISIFSLLLSLVEYKILLLMLGIDAPISVVFMVFSVVGFAFLVPVPMGLGSLEAFQISLFSVLKLGGSAAGIGLAMLTRARDLCWVFAAVILALYHGSLKSLFKEAYNKRHSNPIMKTTVFRSGKSVNINIPVHRIDLGKKKFIPLSKLKKNHDFFKKNRK